MEFYPNYFLSSSYEEHVPICEENKALRERRTLQRKIGTDKPLSTGFDYTDKPKRPAPRKGLQLPEGCPEPEPCELDPNDPEQCPKCDYRNPKPHRVKQHYKEQHVKVQCKYCNKELSLYFIERHVAQKHTQQLDFQCEICSQRFFREHLLLNHVSSFGRTGILLR